MHGIVLETGTAGGSSDEKYARIRRITLRYTHGRALHFVPEARRRFFDEDDALKMAEILEKASQIAEWSQVGEGVAEGLDEERFAR